MTDRLAVRRNAAIVVATFISLAVLAAGVSIVDRHERVDVHRHVPTVRGPVGPAGPRGVEGPSGAPGTAGTVVYVTTSQRPRSTSRSPSTSTTSTTTRATTTTTRAPCRQVPVVGCVP